MGQSTSFSWGVDYMCFALHPVVPNSPGVVVIAVVGTVTVVDKKGGDKLYAY